jgi:hypothetical protein
MTASGSRPEQHRHGASDGACMRATVQFEFEGSGRRGMWKSFCPRCQPYTHYLRPGTTPGGLANILPSRKQGESLTAIDYAALDPQREEERRQSEHDRVLEALGLTEAELAVPPPPIGEWLQQAMQDPSRLHISASFSRLPATGLHVDKRMAVVRHWHRSLAWQRFADL